MEHTESLGAIAAEIMMRAAAEYLRVHKLTCTDDALVACLKVQGKTAIHEAMADAKQAFACGMTAMGEQTFKATLMCAGIAAAKQAVQS